MSTLYSDRQQSDAAGSWSAWELARLFFHWLVAGSVISLIVSLFVLAQIIPGETIPIMISAFAMLGMGLAGFCLWALAVGLPTVHRFFYGPLPAWPRKRQKVTTPWFDRNGTMLWQRDGRGVWVRKVDVAPRMAGHGEPTTPNGFQ